MSNGCRVMIAAIPPTKAYTAHTNARISAKEPNTSMQQSPPLPQGFLRSAASSYIELLCVLPGFRVCSTNPGVNKLHLQTLRLTRWHRLLRTARRISRRGFSSARCFLVLGRALCLHMVGDKAAFGGRLALNQRLRFVHKSVRQRIAPNITHRQSLAFAFQHKIDSPGHAVNTSGLHRAADAHVLIALRALQRIELSEGVVISLA